MLPILLPARAVGSIISGFRFFGNSGSGEGSAGRAVHASLVPRKPTLPACAGGDPRKFAARNALHLHPPSFDPARAVADGETLSTFDQSATNSNHRQKSPSRRHCLCGTAA